MSYTTKPGSAGLLTFIVQSIVANDGQPFNFFLFVQHATKNRERVSFNEAL